jgi:4-hydroxybenzoate polyprenyltransferase
MQLIFRYGFLKLQNIPLALTDWRTYYCIEYRFNRSGRMSFNIFDQDSLENKPNRVVIGKALLNLRPTIYAVKYQLNFICLTFVNPLFAAILF